MLSNSILSPEFTVVEAWSKGAILPLKKTENFETMLLVAEKKNKETKTHNPTFYQQRHSYISYAVITHTKKY